MGKLHQHLAVEDAKATIYKSTTDEAIQTFAKRDHLLKGRLVKQVSKLAEDDPQYAMFPDGTESQPVAETVIGKINWVLQHATAYYDLAAQKDLANCSARADLIIGGKKILENVPAITLLFIENKLKGIRNLLAQAKTLDAARNWTKHEAQEDVWQSDPNDRVIKQAGVEYITAAPATEKHAAQVREVNVEKVRAISTATELSGFMPTTQKADLLMRCDELIQAAKQARQTANDQEIMDTKIGDPLFNYLLNG
tara:strand:- start:1447 stop:2205 length:759 start_codon:yes stop_codon:yes gene_type:complete